MSDAQPDPLALNLPRRGRHWWLFAVGIGVLAVVLAFVYANKSGPPTNAEVSSYCTIIKVLDTEQDGATFVGLKNIGTPDGIPDAARRGFELALKKGEAGRAIYFDQLVDGGPVGLSATQRADFAALAAYTTKTCST